MNPLLLAGTDAAAPSAASVQSIGQTIPKPSDRRAGKPAILERRVIGKSVRGRDLVVWHLGEPGTRTYVLISTMPGNEPRTRAILESLRDGASLDGNDESGSGPAPEPETRAVTAWLTQVRPRRVARVLRLPTTNLDCGGVCHGTMTGWFNHNSSGAALTIEYAANPPRRRLRAEAPRQIVKLLGGRFVTWLPSTLPTSLTTSPPGEVG